VRKLNSPAIFSCSRNNWLTKMIQQQNKSNCL
jgi:hypothetical protein